MKDNFEEVVALPKKDADFVLAALQDFVDLKTREIEDIDRVIDGLKQSLGVMKRAIG